jgi:fructose-1,6-bisphosphatase/inositol monophosphatase family enzyme
MAVINPEKISAILRECAHLYITPRYQKLKQEEISSKTGPHDLVTQADLDVEHHLTRILPAHLPGSIVIGEESVSGGHSSVAVLQDKSQKIWIIDPVDGTHNFVNGKPDFGVMLACVINGRTEISWIYDVLKDCMFVAEKGSGAYQDAKRLRINAQPSALNKMTAHINYKYFPKNLRLQVQESMGVFESAFSVGSAAHEYTRIASGASHLAVYSRLKPWDHLPGALLVEEAGGYLAKWDREPYTPQDDSVGLMVTTDKFMWDEAYKAVFADIDLSDYL